MRKLVITLIVVVGLLVAADFGVAAAAEYQVAKKMRAQFGLTDDPEVRINGFPFLTQAISGDYRDVEIKASGVPVRDELRDLEIQADLHHVRIALSDLLAGNTRGAKVDEVDGSVTIKASDIARLANRVTPITDLSIEPDTRKLAAAVAPTSAPLKLSGNTEIAGRKIKLTAYGVVSLVGGQVQLSANDVQVDDASLPGLGQLIPMIARAFTIPLDPGSLPFTVTPTEVHVSSGALTVQGRATNVPLDGGGVR